jgi:myosin heavy subunit
VTVGFQYKEQLTSLMDTLMATHPHFVRCIIPNHKKRPGTLEAPIVLEQLRCNGVLEGIRISRKGFPNRILYAEFVKRYYILVPGLTRTVADPKAATQAVLEQLKLDSEQFRFGLTKVFFRSGQLAFVEESREKKIGQLIISIQAASRGFLARRMYFKLAGHAGAAKTVCRNVRAFLDFKTWPWWTLFVKARPLLKRRNFEKEMEDKDKSIIDLSKNLKTETEGRQKAEDALRNLETRSEEIKGQLAEERERAAELQDQKEKLDKAKVELEKKLKETEDDLEDETSQRKDLSDLKRKLELKADELQEQLDEENRLRIELESHKRKNEMEIDELKTNVEKQGDTITKLERHKQSIERNQRTQRIVDR